MKTIQLTRGMVAMVDDADYEWLSQYHWQAKPSKRTAYARRSGYPELGYCGCILMHRQILGAKPGQFVDHIDGNGLNNQRSNLRLCALVDNQRRRFVHTSASGFRGVQHRPWLKSRPWSAHICVNDRKLHLGYFPSAEDAARAYDKAAREVFGDFAMPNFGGVV